MHVMSHLGKLFLIVYVDTQRVLHMKRKNNEEGISADVTLTIMPLVCFPFNNKTCVCMFVGLLCIKERCAFFDRNVRQKLLLQYPKPAPPVEAKGIDKHTKQKVVN